MWTGSSEAYHAEAGKAVVIGVGLANPKPDPGPNPIPIPNPDRFRHSHEEYPPGAPAGTEAPVACGGSRPRRGGRPRQTEILLFGVSGEYRRMRLGTALFEYIKHLAVVHSSTQLLVLYNSTSSPGTTAFWRRRELGLVGHWATACGDDNEASRQVPEPLYVSLFNGRDHFLCRRDLEELEGDSLQALTQSIDAVKDRLRDKFKLPDVAEAEGPPDELQKGACHRAQPCIIGLPGVSPSPWMQACFWAGIMLQTTATSSQST